MPENPKSAVQRIQQGVEAPSGIGPASGLDLKIDLLRRPGFGAGAADADGAALPSTADGWNLLDIGAQIFDGYTSAALATAHACQMDPKFLRQSSNRRRRGNGLVLREASDDIYARSLDRLTGG